MTSTVRVEQRWQQGFTRITAVRELADGSMLLVDGQDRSLFVLPGSTGPARQLGRTGSGPGEYRYPVRLAALSGDSTVLVDGQNRRWLLLVGTRFGELRGNLRNLAERVNVDLAGLDDRANAMTIVVKAVPGTQKALMNDPALSDTLFALLFSQTGKVDTIAELWSSSSGRKMVSVPGETSPFSLPSLLSARDQAVLFADGVIAVARTNPYRVEWRSTSGQWLRAPGLTERPIAVTAEIQRSIVRSFKQRADGSALFRVDDFPSWPKFLPPFRPGALVAGGDGNLYVRRTAVDQASAQKVDVFDRRGVRIAMLSLPPGTRLIGSGERSLYLVEKTVDDEELLVRVTWR